MPTIKTAYGDMLAVARGILVHGCNARGEMGGGIALQVKSRFPSAFRVYADAFRGGGLKLGTITVARIEPDQIIVNAVTQDDYHHPDPSVVLVDYDAVEDAFRRVRELAERERLPVHFPLIGCGLARGKWEEVAPRIERALGPNIDKTLWLREPARG